MCAMFAPAARRKLKLRAAICGPAGYGKSYTGGMLAQALAEHYGTKVAAIDTEHGALSKYQGYQFNGSGPFNFDVCELQHFAPSAYVAAIREAAARGYGVLLIDSLSHAWAGVGGALAQVDAKAGGGGNSFTAWKDVTPQHNELVEAILSYPGHVIATMRTKMEYVLEEEDRKGRKVMVPKKIGMKPIQREGMDYEFDIVADMDEAHTLIVGKTRCPAIDGQRVVKPGPEFLTPVLRWLDEGVEGVAAANPTFAPAASSASTPASVGTVGNSTAPPVLASQMQLDEIKAGFLALADSDENRAKASLLKACEKRGISSQDHITEAAAADIIAKLRPAVVAKKAELDKKIGEQEKATAAAGKAKKAAENPTATAAQSSAAATNAQPAMESLSEPEQKLVAAMQAHDWYYPYSDDGKVFSRGQSSETNVHSLARAIPEARRVELWAEFSPKRDGVQQFACPGVDPAKSPKPEPAPSGDTTPADPDRVGSISADDQDAILQYGVKLQIGTEDLRRILGKRKTREGNPVRSVPDLSHNQAQEMIANLYQAYQKRFPDPIPF